MGIYREFWHFCPDLQMFGRNKSINYRGLLSEFPKIRNSEIFRGNREFLLRIREYIDPIWERLFQPPRGSLLTTLAVQFTSRTAVVGPFLHRRNVRMPLESRTSSSWGEDPTSCNLLTPQTSQRKSLLCGGNRRGAPTLSQAFWHNRRVMRGKLHACLAH